MRDMLNMHHTRWELRYTCSIFHELYVIVQWYSAPQWERETLHLFQPPRADQMPDPHQGQCHNILPSIP